MPLTTVPQSVLVSVMVVLSGTGRQQTSHGGSTAKYQQQTSQGGTTANHRQQTSHVGPTLKLQQQTSHGGTTANHRQQPLHDGLTAKSLRHSSLQLTSDGRVGAVLGLAGKKSHDDLREVRFRLVEQNLGSFLSLISCRYS